MTTKSEDEGLEFSADPVQSSHEVPPLPPGRIINLATRGDVFVRDIPGPPGAPTLMLLHGWMATADLNWAFSYEALTREFRVVALDLHGHGRGRRSRHRFTFASCADDVTGVMDALGIARAIAVGYSMGGPVALETARRHGDRIAGLVLCATAGAFSTSPVRRMALRPLGPAVRLTRLVPESQWRHTLRRRVIGRRAHGRWQSWITSELVPSDLTTMLEAGAALTQFNALGWVGDLTMPAAVVETVRDSLVAPAAQRALARALADAELFEVDGDHLVCFEDPEVFAPVLVRASRSVAARGR